MGKSTQSNFFCQHGSYCGYFETVCVETDFKDTCRMRNTSIDKMPLLKKVKANVEKHKNNS